jgi:hypothetical protein
MVNYFEMEFEYGDGKISYRDAIKSLIKLQISSHNKIFKQLGLNPSAVSNFLNGGKSLSYENQGEMLEGLGVLLATGRLDPNKIHVWGAAGDLHDIKVVLQILAYPQGFEILPVQVKGLSPLLIEHPTVNDIYLLVGNSLQAIVARKPLLGEVMLEAITPVELHPVKANWRYKNNDDRVIQFASIDREMWGKWREGKVTEDEFQEVVKTNNAEAVTWAHIKIFAAQKNVSLDFLHGLIRIAAAENQLGKIAHNALKNSEKKDS